MDASFISNLALTGIYSFAQSHGKVLEQGLELPTINIPPAEMDGDFTLVLFPYLKRLGATPQELGDYLGGELMLHKDIASVSLVKGFLNISLTAEYWNRFLLHSVEYWEKAEWKQEGLGRGIMLEYPSPNTNKPLHLGHLRNIFLGSSLALLFEEMGYTVYRVNLYNDRGTNISKSMYAYLQNPNREDPEAMGMKGDKCVGAYYVRYNALLKEDILLGIESGLSEEEAQKTAKARVEVDKMTVKWEEGDEETRLLWKMMNGWFYSGVQETMSVLGLGFDAVYYESDLYHLGKETVEEGLAKGVFYKSSDGSVWVNLEDVGLDHKLVLRSNGTSVYITQDLALAYEKQFNFNFERSIYVVGNEQDYHFKVLFEILKRLGMQAAAHLHHLSYGMVELPAGKMKSREGTVVDADDLMEEVIQEAREKSEEQGKLQNLSEAMREELYKEIGLGALRYFILRVDPSKRIVFNPAESIDFNGDTGPFIQYTHARCCSLLHNAELMGISLTSFNTLGYTPEKKELRLLRLLGQFANKLSESVHQYSPALMAHYVYDVASSFSQFYHDHPVIKEVDPDARLFRIYLTDLTRKVLSKGLNLLDIYAPERM
jgi:arginyl-tRNA synthetase